MCVTINYRNDVRSAILRRLKTPRFYSFLRLASRLDSSAARHKLLPLQYRKDQTVRSRGQKMRVGGGAGGIRTLDTGLPYTHFPGVRLRPLGHCSACRLRQGRASSGLVGAVQATCHPKHRAGKAGRTAIGLSPQIIQEMATQWSVSKLPAHSVASMLKLLEILVYVWM